MQSMKANPKKSNLLLVLYIFVISCCLYSMPTYGGNMEPLYVLNRAKPLDPQVLHTGVESILSLFPVPQDNSIGTNDLSNAITLMSFDKGKIKYDKHFKNAVHDVQGGGEYMPIISQDLIGFGQTRRFLLYDFRYKICHNYRIVVSLEKTIEKIALANGRTRHFIFEIQAHNGKSQDPWDYTSHLLLMDLSDKEARVIKEIDKGKGVTWTIASDKIFLYHIGTEQLQVLDTTLAPSHHPLVDVIKKNKNINFTRLQAHPFLPFAILFAGDEGSTLVSWAHGKVPHKLFSGADQFSFSPDGKWVVFRCDRTDPAKTYLMPISDKYPNFIGPPILLLNYSFNENNYGWTTNPISFVGSRLDKIYRWELTNAAHPESDKATFWDFVVEHDLEKLTKEKRQGLGEEQK